MHIFVLPTLKLRCLQLQLIAAVLFHELGSINLGFGPGPDNTFPNWQ